MNLTQKMLKRVNIYSASRADSGYVGTKSAPSLLGYVYAQVFPERETLSAGSGGLKKSGGATLILRREAGVCCGDLAGIYGDEPDSRITEIRRFPDHSTVRTERL